MILVLAFVRKAIRWAIAGAMPALATTLAAISLAAPAQATKIVVTHHPFDLPEGHHERNLVFSGCAASNGGLFYSLR